MTVWDVVMCQKLRIRDGLLLKGKKWQSVKKTTEAIYVNIFYISKITDQTNPHTKDGEFQLS